ncbi:MAG: choice-of-anchor H family protein [Woeseiaceae bacterium]|nr:choice-of-anchor H family protein [Woeseiaceae bacterium]
MNRTRFAWTLIIVVGTLGAGPAMAATTDDATTAAETRVSESRFYRNEGREQAVPDRIAKDERTTAATGQRSAIATRGGQQKLANVAQTPNVDFWFYSADVELFNDDDRDGFYHGIDLWFDADTIYTRAEVFAVVYLSLEGGPWMEYAETEDFAIYGTSSTDDFVIVSELLAGYPAGSYDILIELFDAFDGTFLADFGPESTSELAFLPLEDAARDTPAPAPVTPVVVSRGGGGAADWLLLAMLGVVVASVGAVRRRRSAVASVLRRGRGA